MPSRFWRVGGNPLSPSRFALGAPGGGGSIYPFTTLAAGTTGTELRSLPNWATLGSATDAALYQRNGSGAFYQNGYMNDNIASGLPVLDTSNVNHSISAPIVTSNNYGGLAFGLVDINNYLILVGKFGEQVKVHKLESGVITSEIISVSDASLVSGDILTAHKHTGGTLFTVLKNGTPIITDFAVPTAMQAGTKVGLATWSNDMVQVGDITVNNV
jgi:hypothetical protein